jgi:DNA-binding transcriptional LysR family regulator
VSPNSHPLDDRTIPDDAELWRRIHPRWFVLDEVTGERRVSTQAFENSPDDSGTSVVIAAESSEAMVMAGFDDYGLAMLTAGLAREQGQGVRRVPLPDVPGHAQIEGQKTRLVKKALAAGCRLLRRPRVI